MRGAPDPRVEGHELGAVGGSSRAGEPAGKRHPYWEHWEGAEGESTEPLLGELEELSHGGSVGSSAGRSCVTWSTGDTGLACAVADAPAGSPAQRHAGHGGGSQEGTATPEAVGDKALEM